MNKNCQEIISDVERWFLIPQESKQYAIPETVKMTQISAQLMGANSLPDFLHALPFFSISMTEPLAETLGNQKVFLMKEKTQVKVNAKKTIKGLIFTLSATISVVNPSKEDETELIKLSEGRDYDFVLQYADGTYRLFRSLANTSFVQLEDSSKSDRTLSLKLTAQSVTSLIPII